MLLLFSYWPVALALMLTCASTAAGASNDSSVAKITQFFRGATLHNAAEVNVCLTFTLGSFLMQKGRVIGDALQL
jgi:hypothetical protein